MDEAKTLEAGSICPRCGRRFTCGMQAGHGKCWCADLPHRPPPDPEEKDCYCPECLEKILVQAPRKGDGPL